MLSMKYKVFFISCQIMWLSVMDLDFGTIRENLEPLLMFVDY